MKSVHSVRPLSIFTPLLCPYGPYGARCCPLPYRVWLGWAYMAKTVRKPQRGGVNFDTPMIFCACSMQNTPAASEIPPDDFRAK